MHKLYRVIRAPAAHLIASRPSRSDSCSDSDSDSDSDSGSTDAGCE